MKKIVRIFVVASLLITFSCKKEVEKTEEITTTKSLEENAKVPKTKVTFDKEIHDFGEIEQGEIVETTFLIKNVGDKNLYIVDAHGSCGCTVPTYSKEPIAPGAKGVIGVKYDTSRAGQPFSKTVTITSNAAGSPSKVLTIKGTVLAADAPKS